MATINDGGSAFPVTGFNRPVGDNMSQFQFAPNGGMTLRDYFAAKVMASITLAAGQAVNDLCGNTDRLTSLASFMDEKAIDRLLKGLVDQAAQAKRAYEIADAMIAERAKAGGQ